MPLHNRLAQNCCVVVLLAAWAVAQQAPRSAPPASSEIGYAGNEACASCHHSIYQSYSKTFMARASGLATENLIPADFVHRPSGVHYRIFMRDGKAWLSFDRPNDPAVRGQRQLLYYIGSGRRGRTYLFSVDGFLFESPVNWYSDRRVWDLTPGYGNDRQIPMNLPAFPSCLACHVSGMQPPVAGTENRYPTPVFAEPGVSCERCHGPGAAHLHGGPIVNPAKLSPSRRDAVCMQCHLEGKVAVEQPGKHIYDFRPGDDLADYVRYYVLAQTNSSGLGAVSQFEALAQSQCKKKSGDAMSCMSCHDPHASPTPSERVAYYRGKCLACHGDAFGATHHPGQADCTSCHMPSSLSTDVAHTEVTDHRILRRPELSPQSESTATSPASQPSLVSFPISKEAMKDTRSLALAWESLAESGMSSAGPKAEELLRAALKKSADDPAILSSLAYDEQKRGAVDHARALYGKALAADPALLDAATNLGVIEAGQGDLHAAVSLWQGAFQRAPGRSGIGMNLARAFCNTGQFDVARNYTLRVLEFNPDLTFGKQLLKSLDRTPPSCQ